MQNFFTHVQSTPKVRLAAKDGATPAQAIAAEVVAAIRSPRLIAIRLAAMAVAMTALQPQAGIRACKSWCVAFPGSPQASLLQRRHVTTQWLALDFSIAVTHPHLPTVAGAAEA